LQSSSFFLMDFCLLISLMIFSLLLIFSCNFYRYFSKVGSPAMLLNPSTLEIANLVLFIYVSLHLAQPFIQGIFITWLFISKLTL
jgi:hypothetical protein